MKSNEYCSYRFTSGVKKKNIKTQNNYLALWFQTVTSEPSRHQAHSTAELCTQEEAGS